MNNRKKKKLQTDEDSMCSFESRWLLLKKNRKYARVAQLVEYDLAKVGVAGSSPVSRSSLNDGKLWFTRFSIFFIAM